MTVRFTLAATAAASLLALSAPVTAQDFAAPIDLPKGATIDLVIEKTKTEIREGKAQPTAGGTFRYRQTLTPDGDGYRVRQVMTDSSFMGGAKPSGQESQMLAAASEVSYRADESLAPVEMLDWPATVERLFGLIGKVDPDSSPDAMAQARKMFVDMGPALAAQVVLRQQNILAMPQALPMDLGEPIEEVQQVPNPLGGSPIDSVFRVELVSVDKAASRAVVRSTQTLDPASANRSMRLMMDELTKRGTAKSSTVPDFRMERTIVCTYDMDTGSGLTAKADCLMKATFAGGGETAERTERDVITQTLVSQP